MRSRYLVIGPGSLREAIARAVPNSDVLESEFALDGLWKSGHEHFDGVFISLSVGANALPAVRNLRKVAPQTRIVIACNPVDEPLARRALSEGADEYVLEPLQREEVERACRIVSPPEEHALPLPEAPSVQEITHLAEVLQTLADGPQETLDRLADLLQQAFDTTGVVLELDDLASYAGEIAELLLEQPIRRNEQTVGRIALARRNAGAYTVGAASRLTVYARLIEAVVSRAFDRTRLQELAWTDDLSGLRNRRYFAQKFDALIADAQQRRLQLSLFLFDIDDFKSYNDRHGHDAGDALIREVAVLLGHCTRERDVIVRYGGDEFAVVFWESEKPRVPGSKHPAEAMALIERFREAIRQHHFKFLGPDRPGPVTISGGVATMPWDGSTRERLVKAADQALLAAKRTGKNSIRLAGDSTAEASSLPES